MKARNWAALAMAAALITGCSGGDTESSGEPASEATAQAAAATPIPERSATAYIVWFGPGLAAAETPPDCGLRPIAGDQIELHDADDAVVAVARLEHAPEKQAGELGNTCVWRADFNNLPGASDFYRTVFGERRSDLEPADNLESVPFVIEIR